MLMHKFVACLFVAGVCAQAISVKADNLDQPNQKSALCKSSFTLSVAVLQDRNIIRGRITSTTNRPVERLRVELQNEVEMFVAQSYTDALGRYSFSNLSFGTFIIKVHSNGVYAASSARVTLTPARVGGGGSSPSHQEELDFALPTFQELRNKNSPSNAGVAFVQDVPENARKQYEKATGLLDQKKSEEGVNALKEALKLFSDYYLAWERLGIEYVKLEHYDAADFSLGHALRVNPNSASSHYALGYTQYQRRQWPEAGASLNRSLRLAPTSPNAPMAHYYWGLALVKENKPSEAESQLKRAQELGRNNIPAEAHMSLAQLYSNSKRYKEAADELDTYLKRVPNASNAEALRNLIKQLRSKETAPSGAAK